MSIENRIRIPAIIALAIQGALTLISIILVIFQEPLVKALYMRNLYDQKTSVHFLIPSSVIFMIVYLALYSVYVGILYKYNGTKRRVVGIVFLVVYLAVAVLSGLVSYVSSMIVGRFMGTMDLAVYSSVSSLVSIPAVFLGFAPAPLFFFSLGRYSITVAE